MSIIDYQFLTLSYLQEKMVNESWVKYFKSNFGSHIILDDTSGFFNRLLNDKQYYFLVWICKTFKHNQKFCNINNLKKLANALKQHNDCLLTDDFTQTHCNNKELYYAKISGNITIYELID